MHPIGTDTAATDLNISGRKALGLTVFRVRAETTAL